MNVVLADDHPIVMIGIRNALLPVKEIRIRGEADSASGLIRLLEHETPDILITDFYMPGSRQGDGIGLVTYVQRNFPAVRLIVLTMLTNPAVLRAIVDAGVQAGHGGRFGLVVGVDRGVGEQALRDAGANVVVADLEELI